jgi:quercetin dioxygenase-like cupin family protein
MTAAATFTPRVLLRSEETAGVLSAIEIDAHPDFAGPPLHQHDFDETFHILEGELTFQLDGERHTARAGELVFARRGQAHTVANLSGRLARYLLVCTPAGFERYFARNAASQDGVDTPEWANQPIPEVTTVGPPIGSAQ